METKIGEFRGFTIVYNPRDKVFTLLNTDGDIVGSGKTQDEVEKQADKLSKKGYKFPIEAFQNLELYLLYGKVTSINLSDESVRFVRTKKGGEKYHGVTHNKEFLRYSKLYEATEANHKISAEVSNRRAQISQLEDEIKILIGQLEKPMKLKYFGLNQVDHE